ncbi:hypothetical protein LR48_Vigan11g120300 [Vigna angularis]|uniref:Uncharacterized protein n=1 Tax=Phaseolus angularis TaxID=3914 RepID=A0A0L9VTS0_PHAAN|nr:UPF0481 protein At3g47200 [Vigna angularis]KAG2380857.1 uncharacterized protein HKW66_Vig0202300 [Vigna angularis]KOM58169.1 hypothetical protein LR48_Vigan11g120300 [Vigna angularis]
MDREAGHKNTILDEWADSMSTMLGCVDNEDVETCSLYLVSNQLRKSKMEAYMPHVVSIGPLHQGKIMELQHMEKIKWRCLTHLLSRSERDPQEALRNCGRYLLKLDEVVRASYSVDDLGFNRSKLAKIMGLDGCFLLELLISSSTELDNRIQSNLSNPSPGASVILWEKVLSDLTILENQIPLIVLYALSHILFPKVFTGKDGKRLIQEHALSILGYNYGTLGSTSHELKVFHFLELVHASIVKEKEKDRVKEDLTIPIVGEDKRVTNRKVKLDRCATRLQAAGVKIEGTINEQRRNSSVAAMNRFDLRVKFSDGKLEIPQLRITETTEAKWRNFIAWEVNKNKVEKQNGERAISDVTNESGIRFHFLCYAWFFKSLICSVHDVRVLLDSEVIWVAPDKEGKRVKSDEDLVDLFRKMTEGISESDLEETDTDPWISKVIMNLNSYPSTLSATGTCRITWHIFRGNLASFCYNWTHSFRVLRRDYIPTRWKLIAVLAAAAGLILTALQTAFSAPRRK